MWVWVCVCVCFTTFFSPFPRKRQWFSGRKLYGSGLAVGNDSGSTVERRLAEHVVGLGLIPVCTAHSQCYIHTPSIAGRTPEINCVEEQTQNMCACVCVCVFHTHARTYTTRTHIHTTHTHTHTHTRS